MSVNDDEQAMFDSVPLIMQGSVDMSVHMARIDDLPLANEDIVSLPKKTLYFSRMGFSSKRRQQVQLYDDSESDQDSQTEVPSTKVKLPDQSDESVDEVKLPDQSDESVDEVLEELNQKFYQRTSKANISNMSETESTEKRVVCCFNSDDDFPDTDSCPSTHESDKDDLAELDPAVGNSIITINSQANPFYLPIEGSPLYKTFHHDLEFERSGVFFVCRRSSEIPFESVEMLYQMNTTIDQLKTIFDSLEIVKLPLLVCKIPTVRRGLIEIDRQTVERIGIHNDQLDELCLFYLMLENTVEQVQYWAKIYHMDTFNEMMKHIKFSLSNGIKDRYLITEIINLIWKVPEFSDWDNPNACKFSINEYFNSRRFNIGVKKGEVEKEIADILKNFKESNKSGYQSNDNAGKGKGYIKFDDDRYYQIMTREDMTLEPEIIKNLLLTKSLGLDFSIHFLSRIITSRRYCHLILDNEILEACTPIIKKHTNLFHTLFGYLWSTLYNEEYIKRSNLITSDRCVVDLNIASKLPLFIFSYDKHWECPYLPLHISDCILSDNIGGVRFVPPDQKGIVNLDTFRRRLNIMITSHPDIDVFEGMDWTDLAVTGGAMAAIMPVCNPLIGNHENTNDINNFFRKFYSETDIDIACKAKTIIGFVDTVKRVETTVRSNLSRLSGDKPELCIIPSKTLCIRISKAMLQEVCGRNEIPFEYHDVIKNRYSNRIKFYFYNMYLEAKIENNENNVKNLGSRIEDPCYLEIVKPCLYENVSVVVTDYHSKDPAIIDDEISWMFNVNVKCDTVNGTEERHFITFQESYKYRIRGGGLKQDLEIFRMIGDDFFSCVGRFHLPCVRSYYDGTQCYLTSSAVCSYMTLINIDFKYFVGSRDPINIIDKYRRRGYGTILNKFEREQYIRYISERAEYSKRYPIVNGKHSITGIMDTVSPLFGCPPRVHNNVPVLKPVGQFIGNKGHLIPFNRWMVDMVCNNMK
jgi:hypothetical protein